MQESKKYDSLLIFVKNSLHNKIILSSSSIRFMIFLFQIFSYTRKREEARIIIFELVGHVGHKNTRFNKHVAVSISSLRKKKIQFGKHAKCN